MKNHLTLSIILLFSIVSCVNDPQDIPPSLQTNPVFFAHLNVGQETLHIAAGEDGYKMDTEHFVDDEGITHYVATLSSEPCTQGICPVLEFEFFDHQVISHPASGADYTFVPGIKEFYNADKDGTLDIKFFLVQDGSGSHVSYWTTAGDTMPLTSSEIHLSARPDEYIDLCFQRDGDSTCEGFALYCFRTLASSPFIGLLSAEKSIGDYILVEMDLQGEAPFSYSWMNGATTPYILIPGHEGEEVSVEVVVTDATQSRIEIQQTIRIVDATAVMCGGTPQFVYSIADAPFTQFSTAIVRFTDSAGNIFSSEFGPQPKSQFEILSVADFDESPEGFETKLIELSITSVLYSEDGNQTLDLSASNTIVAVSYDK